MSEPDLVLTAVPVYVGIAVVLFLVQWPGRPQAIRLLQRWGVADPTDVEIAEARHYLRRRQVTYPLFYLVYSISILLLLPEPPPLLALILAVMITSGLVAEVVITWQSAPVGALADHVPLRVVRALVPGWIFALAVALLAAFAVLIGASLLGQAWAGRVIPDPMSALVCGGAAAVFSAASVWLAVRRPARGAGRADAALRLCTARTSLALGVFAVSGVATLGGSLGGYVFAALGLAAAFATTSSGRNRRLPIPLQPNAAQLTDGGRRRGPAAQAGG